MSQENDPPHQVDANDFASRVTDALNRRDSAALLGLVHPDYRFHSRLAVSEGRVYSGPNGFDDYFRDIEETLANLRFELDEIVGWRRDDLVLVLRMSAQGRASGVPIDRLPLPQVWTFRDGRIWRNIVFATTAEALEAAGLSE